MDSSRPEKKISPSKAEPTELGVQRRIFPVEIRDIYRNDQGSADLQMIGTGINNKDYAIKTVNDGNGYVPATELFCYELARELSIATPSYDIIKMRDNSLAFGSMWEGGATVLKEMVKVWDLLKGAVTVRGLKSFFSHVYALDIFINNIDRHFGNYIFRDSYSGTIALAYDFSRAWYAFDPIGYQCLDGNVNTGGCHELIRKTGNFDPKTAKETLDQISRVDVRTLAQIISLLPETWMPTDARNELLSWWGSTEMMTRIAKLKSGIK